MKVWFSRLPGRAIWCARRKTRSKSSTAELGGTDFVLGFDCILRRLDSESRQVRHKVEELYQRFGVAGFHTYGEQFNAMHLNQTLTGIAFGKPGSRS